MAGVGVGIPEVVTATTSVIALSSSSIWYFYVRPRNNLVDDEISKFDRLVGSPAEKHAAALRGCSAKWSNCLFGKTEPLKAEDLNELVAETLDVYSDLEIVIRDAVELKFTEMSAGWCDFLNGREEELSSLINAVSRVETLDEQQKRVQQVFVLLGKIRRDAYAEVGDFRTRTKALKRWPRF